MAPNLYFTFNWILSLESSKKVDIARKILSQGEVFHKISLAGETVRAEVRYCTKTGQYLDVYMIGVPLSEHKPGTRLILRDSELSGNGDGILLVGIVSRVFARQFLPVWPICQ